MDTNPPVTTQLTNESTFEAEDKGSDDKVYDEAPSGEATSAQEVQTSRDKILVDSSKTTKSVFLSSLEIDTSSLAKEKLAKFNIIFDKPYH